MTGSVCWSSHAWEDYCYWQTTDKRICKRINALITATMRTPFEGEGKPEPLRFQLAGLWSRRITAEHRLVYAWNADTRTLTILQCRYHY